MERFLEYRVINDGKVLQDWTEDYANVRKIKRSTVGEEASVEVREVTKEPQRSGFSEPEYDVDELTRNLLEVLKASGTFTLPESPKEQYDEAERLALAVMPLFAESIALSIVKKAHNMWGADFKDDDMRVSDHAQQKIDKQEEAALIVRRVGGVKGWSRNAGTGYRLDL